MSELKIKDVINSIKTIEQDCEQIEDNGVTLDPDYKKFYERVKGLMIFLEESTRKSGGFIMG
jgi:hypothetical protein